MRFFLAFMLLTLVGSIRTVENVAPSSYLQQNSMAPEKGEPCTVTCGDLPWNKQPADCCAKGLECQKMPGRGYRCEDPPWRPEKKTGEKGDICDCGGIPSDEQPADCCAEGLECRKMKGRGYRCQSPSTEGTEGSLCTCGDIAWDEQPKDCCAEGLVCAKQKGKYQCKIGPNRKCKRYWFERADNTRCGGQSTHGFVMTCGKQGRCCVPSIHEKGMNFQYSHPFKKGEIQQLRDPTLSDQEWEEKMSKFAARCCSGKVNRVPLNPTEVCVG